MNKTPLKWSDFNKLYSKNNNDTSVLNHLDCLVDCASDNEVFIGAGIVAAPARPGDDVSDYVKVSRGATEAELASVFKEIGHTVEGNTVRIGIVAEDRKSLLYTLEYPLTSKGACATKPALLIREWNTQAAKDVVAARRCRTAGEFANFVLSHIEFQDER